MSEKFSAGLLGGALLLALPAAADPFSFSTGNPDGKIGTLSRPGSAGQLQTETADDFILSQPTRIDSATFTGLLPSGAPLSTVSDVEIEFYHVFPTDSANPPSGNVPTR
ncbi:MAG TPA: PEP-CTERM sorting domain-containing protein, partial [Myxococcota bacterium]|nr:PEP-CTERM sorting domain-containing protein [Myxococcota bacterium]